MHWLSAVEQLRRERRAGVLLTVTVVRGHAPRDAGAKMVVADDGAWGSIGGGNLEATAVARARELLGHPAGAPEELTLGLTDRTHTDHGRQCCGGEVTVLLEPLPVVPAVAVYGIGHVGLELARLLARHDLELHLVDSRADQLTPERLSCLDHAEAAVHIHHSPVPEVTLGSLPSGTDVLIMTHDHAEDFALCDEALRSQHVASIGLIGSAAKWARFRAGLAAEGHDAAAIARVRTPIGMPEPSGKAPATIALSVAAWLLLPDQQASHAGEAVTGRGPAPRSTARPR